MALRLYGEKHEMPQQTRVLLGRAYLDAGDAPKAEAVTERALAALQGLHPEGHPDVARTQGFLARIELSEAHAARAEQLARAAIRFRACAVHRAGNLRVAEAQGLLGECLLAAGQRDAGRSAAKRDSNDRREAPAARAACYLAQVATGVEMTT